MRQLTITKLIINNKESLRDTIIIKCRRHTLLLIVSLLIVNLAYAMDTPPPQSNAPTPEVEFIRTIGIPGSGDGQFYSPTDVDSAIFGNMQTELGSVFVVDSGNNRVERLDAAGDYMYQFGRFGTDNGKFNSPIGIAVDFNFRIYVSDRDNDRVQLFDIRGNYITDIATGEYNLRTINDPAGAEIDQMGNFYLADSSNDRILKFNDVGELQLSIGGFGFGAGFFDNPKDVAVDKNEYIYVADTDNDRVQVLDFDGYPVISFGEGKLRQPQGIAVDDNYVYVADTGNDEVKIFSKTGKLLLTFDDFNRPQGLSVGQNGSLYIADTNNNRVQEYKVSY